MDTIMDRLIGHVRAQLLSIFLNILDIQDNVGHAVTLFPLHALGQRLVGREHQDGAIQIGFLLKFLLGSVYGVDPARLFRVGVQLFPLIVEIPFSFKTLEEAGAILREGSAVLRREVGKVAANEGDGWKQDVLHAPTEIPVEEGAVEDQAIDGAMALPLVQVIRGDESACRVSHQPNPLVPLGANRGERRVDVREILTEILAEEGILVRAERASVFPEVERIEVVTPCVDTIAKLSLEEIVVIAVHVEDRIVRVVVSCPFDECANHLALIVIRHPESPLEIIVSQDIRLVLWPNRLEYGQE